MSWQDYEHHRDACGNDYWILEDENEDVYQVIRIIPDAYDHEVDKNDILEMWEQIDYGVEKGPYADYPGSNMACSRFDGGAEIGFSYDYPSYDNGDWAEINNIGEEYDIITIVHAVYGIRPEYRTSLERYAKEGGRRWFL